MTKGDNDVTIVGDVTAVAADVALTSANVSVGAINGVGVDVLLMSMQRLRTSARPLRCQICLFVDNFGILRRLKCLAFRLAYLTQ